MRLLGSGSLETRVAQVLLLLLVLPTTLVAWLAYDFTRTTIRDERIKTVGRVADARHEQLAMVFQRAIARGEALLADLDKRCDNPPGKSDCLRSALNAFIRSEGALGAVLFDAHGKRIEIGDSAVPPVPPPLFRPQQLAQFTPRAAGHERRYFIVANDAQIGLRLAITYSVRVVQPIFVAHPDLGNSGENFLSDQEGFFVTNARYPAQQGHSHPISATPMRRCLSPESAETLDLDYREVPIIHGFRFVPEIGGGCIMAHIDQAEAFAPLQSIRDRFLVAMLLFAVFAVFVARQLARRIARPIRQLTAVTGRIAGGDLTARAEPLGYDEAVALARAFNAMTDRLAEVNANLEQRVAERTESLRLMSTVFQNSGEGICITDADNRIVAVNRTFVALTGYTEAEAIGKSPSLLASDQTTAEVYAQMWADLNRSGYWQGEMIDRRRDGSIFPVWLAISAARDDTGRIVNYFASFNDISARKRAEQELLASESRYRSIFESANTAIASTDIAGRIVSYNEAFRSMLGYDAAALERMNFADLTHPDDLAVELPLLDDILAGRRDHYRIEKRYIAADGRTLWVDISVGAIRDATGEVRSFVGVIDDITEQRRTENELNLMAKVFTSSGEGIVITDAANRIVMVNRAFTRLTGYSADDVVGRDPKMLAAGRTPRAVYEDLWRALAEHDFWEGELWDRRKSGEPYPKWISIVAVRNANGDLTHYIGSFTDISERKAAEERMMYIAHHDALTDLPNRLNLQQRLLQVLNLAKRNDERVALLMIDLDRFKPINDAFGHHVGDRLLIEVARRLRGAVRESDIVARLGGDEFVVVVAQLESREAVAGIAEKIVTAISAPYHIEGKDVRTAPSIGIAFFPDHAGDPVDLLKRADTAMYHAKAAGRGCLRFFGDDNLPGH